MPANPNSELVPRRPIPPTPRRDGHEGEHLRRRAIQPPPDELNVFYGTLLREGRRDGKGGLSPKTVHNIHVMLHKALHDAVRWNYLPRNVAEFADPPRQTAGKAMSTWTPEELRTFLQFVEDNPLYAAWVLAANTGMRRGEVLGLRWQDIDFDRRRLAIRHTIISIDYRVEISEPKTARGRRSVALDGGTVAALRAHRAAQNQEKLMLGEAYRDAGLVFCRADGTPVHPDRFTQMFDKHVKECDLPRIRLHDLRHTHATLALAAGIHSKVVSERLGHSTVAFTMDVYSHAIPSMEAEAAETIAKLVRGDRSGA
ncbi:MAG: tyrosine-type recombinase/integrase [Actinobacteria bacterium]|nr:tyrosine-type recombinase/integrase [Actinomycetota bacterium]